MKVSKLLIVVASLAYLWGCKASSTDVTPSTPHRWYDAQGNVYLAPPAPGEGIQIAVDTFSVPLGKEVQGDYYFTLPTTTAIKVGRIEIAMNKGSHHMNCFRLNTPINIGDTNISYRKMFFAHDGKVDTQSVKYQQTFYVNTVWNNSDIMVEAQTDSLDWELATLPSDTSVPASIRGAKTVVEFQAGQQMIIENHYVNASVQSTPNGMGKIYINLYYANEANTTSASMYVGRYQKLQIPPHVTDYAVPWVSKFPADLQFPIFMLGMTGHYHSHGKQFYVDVVQELFDSLGQFKGIDPTPVKSKVYINATWNEPPFVSFDPPIKVDVGQSIRFTAVYDNPSDSTILFGGHVLYQEHDNLFAWFVPGWNGGRSVYDNGP